MFMKRSVRPFVQSGWQRPGQEVLELLEENGVGCGEERELGPSFFPGRRTTAGAKGGCNNESKSYTKRTVWGHFLILKKM